MGSRWRGICIAVLLVLGPGALTGALSQTAYAAPSRAERPGALTAQWVLPGSTAPVGSQVAGALRIVASVALHGVAVTLDPTGAASVSPPNALGSLAPDSPQQVSAPFTITGPGTGTLHAVVSGLTATGARVRTAVDVDFATAGQTAALSLSGLLDAQTAALALTRASLGTAAYDQRLARLLGSGAQERFARGPAPAAVGAGTTTTVSGTIQYTDSAGGKHPARTIAVEIRDADGSSANGSLVASTMTDATGAYTASVATLRADGKTPRQLFVRALAQGTGFVIKGVGAALPQHIDSSTHAAAAGALAVDLTANKTADNNTAFDVADALVSAIQYTKRINGGATYANITASFPDPKGTNFNSTTNVARILKLDRFDWDVILHEYGHFVAAQLKIDTSLGGAHGFTENLAETRGKSKGIRLAWSEGFATGFAITAEDVLGVKALAIPNVGDTFYDDTEDSTFHVDLQTQAGFPSLGEDNELSVARFLWHAYKDAKLAMADTLILSTLKAAGSDTLSKAVAALLPAAKAAPFDDSADGDPAAVKHSNDFACALTDQVVAPKITAPADATMAKADMPPTFKWDANGAGPSNRLNKFTVQFWSPNWDKLIFESAQQAGTSYTPTMADWKDKIIGGKDKNGHLPPQLNVVVKGSGTNAPATGPYKSCAITLQVTHIDLVFAIDTTGSMFPYISSVVASASSVVDTLASSGIDYRIGVVDYKDVDSTIPGCPPDYAAVIDLPFSTTKADIVSSLGSLSGKVGGGCDIPEDVYSGVDTAIGFPWRSGVKKAIIQMGDAPGHDPEAHSGLTLASVTAHAAAVDPAVVFPILVGPDPSAHAFDQALATATGGQTIDATANPSDAGPAVLAAIAKIAAAPSASAGGPYTGKTGAPVTFDASGSTAVAPATIASYTWDFGDGTPPVTVTTPTTTHTYASPISGGTVRLTVTDSVGATGLATAGVTITGVSTPPAITSADHAQVVVGTPLAFTVTATGVPAPTLSESGALPTGVTFDPATGLLGGTPASGTVGTYHVVLTATNGVSPAAMQSFTLTVAQAASAASVVASPASQTFGGPVTFAATVVPAAANALTPTGRVSFFLDGQATPVAVLGLGSGGRAAFTTTGLGAGGHAVAVVYAGDPNFTSSRSSSPASVSVTCTTTIPAGSHAGTVTASTGATCLRNVRVLGAVTIKPGAAVDIEGSTIDGPLTASGAGALRVCATAVTGALDVSGATGFVLIGDSGDDACAPNTIGGALILRNNARGVDAIGNTVSGPVSVSGNSGAGAFPVDSAPDIHDN